MHVIALDREVEQAKTRRIAACRTEQSEANGREKVLTSERGQASAQGYVNGLGRAVPRARAVRSRRAR
jgi:hypothetical protein